MAGLRYSTLSFADLKGWADDDHQAALDVYALTRAALGDEWPKLPQGAPPAQAFFEQSFVPVLIEDGAPMLFTGYYEPELDGALSPSDRHRYPAYAVPPDLDPAVPYLTRQQIEADKALAGRGLELAWFADPVDLFFLQVQGSGRVRLPDGGFIRLGFAAKNGHPYTSVGRALVAQVAFSADEVSPEVIRNWVATNGDAGRALLWQNESYVFFRRIDDVPADTGPLGAMGAPVTAGRTVAVDPAVIPLGAPVWIEAAGSAALNRLMVAQDTGSAIKGAQRADIFFGTGELAGEQAGAVKDGGRMVTLLPPQVAARLGKGGHDA